VTRSVVWVTQSVDRVTRSEVWVIRSADRVTRSAVRVIRGSRGAFKSMHDPAEGIVTLGITKGESGKRAMAQ